ncbi:16S rRNA (cytosine(967)-C(5))-methyltransferase RsmB [Ligilactobacillus pobuzihii]|uniref:16S rRNA (cytosine(967)-C(5))-methyltransferase RsmB n=1 Tax=Ligilactobacillus pobuzihii TaxID=449659 RepID=UPI0019D07B4B|nr:16S rRNA (cytosine(967)-C(5))-methyltransferase RsmB [Ligilactobacillus pobuzihii]MBN7275615.1 16S rRNA (cytosine(967)-C(5))-methyltransferase RsmB [Ligilactobacillus pobuzihii]
MTSKIEKSARYLAVRDLTRIEKESSYSNKVVDQTLESQLLLDRDVNLYTNLVYGTIQNKLTLDFYLKPFLKDPNKLDLWVKQLLRISVYQMAYLDRVPQHAIFNEAIEISKQMGHEGTRRFVTGVLHAITRKGLSTVSEIDDPIKKISVQTSTPEWLVKKLNDELGKDKTDSLLKSTLQTPKQSIRINSRTSSLAEVQDSLKKQEITTSESRVSPSALVVHGGFIPQSAAYKAGKITVQDESAILSVESMKLKPDDQVLDVCAAPGGKTTQIAEKLTGTGHVDALDIHKNKLRLIQRNVERMHLSGSVTTRALDARKSGTVFSTETFDKILVDAPCSGLGLLRRKPEIKYEKNATDILKLAQIQLEILQAAAPLVKKGGQLTYSTCTILNDENQSVIDKFLAENSDFAQIKTETNLQLKKQRTESSLTLYPDDYGSDGFFIATLVKQK